ncbi:MAG: gamma carbonic anhydrase family protein [Bdellovibrio sp.]|nr:gamma carbonic anhydrase family protein [Bdellovibrio sp.]
MPLIKARGGEPQLGSDVFITDSSQIVGDVRIGQGSSVWFNTTLRGDVMPIHIGDETNVQDGSVLHGTFGKFACVVGNRVTIGHSVILHGCKIGNSCLIGMGSIIMDGAEIADQCVVGAGSLVTEGKQFSPKSLIMGRPAKFVRELNEAEIKFLEQSADNYLLYKTWYK